MTEIGFDEEISLMKDIESQRTKDLMGKFFGSDNQDLKEFEYENVKYSLQKDSHIFVLKYNNKHITFSETGEGQEFSVDNSMNRRKNVIRELKVYDHKAINDTLSKYLTKK